MIMKFGEIKTIVENNLIDSVKDKSVFKENMKNFKKHFLKDPNLSKLYLIYDDLLKPRGLNEEDASKYLKEGISLAKSLIKKTKLPVIKNKLVENNYQSIDALVYESAKTISESLDSKNKVLSILQAKPIDTTNFIKLPISAMLKVSNEKISEYISKIDESSKKELIALLSENKDDLKNKFKEIKENILIKLNTLKESESDLEVKNKVDKTIEKITLESFDILNYYTLNKLNESLN
jgi:hypothetical protein